jgi:hypothetical protein
MVKMIILGLILLGLSGCATPSPHEQFTKAIRNGDIASVDKMVKEGVKTTHPFPPEYYLEHAIFFDKKEVLELLLNSGYAADSKDTSGLTALHKASQLGKLEMVKLLLSRNANPNIMDNCGRLPLGWADIGATSTDDKEKKYFGISGKKEDYLEISKLLKANGASYNVKEVCGVTPLLKMAQQTSCNLYYNQILNYYQYDINAVECEGNTAYHYATLTGLQRLLEAKGANPNIKNKQGYTPSENWKAYWDNVRASEELSAKQRAESHPKSVEEHANFTSSKINLLRDKSRSSFLHDYIVIFECLSTKDKRRYEVTADDQSEATNLARDDIHKSQWCGYNETFVSANQATQMQEVQSREPSYWQMNVDAAKRDLENMQNADSKRRNAEYKNSEFLRK